MYIRVVYILWNKTTNKLLFHPYKPVSWLPTYLRADPLMREELVVYLFFSSTIYTSLYFYVLSTVLRRSSQTLRLVCIYIYIYFYIISSYLFTISGIYF